MRKILGIMFILIMMATYVTAIDLGSEPVPMCMGMLCVSCGKTKICHNMCNGEYTRVINNRAIRIPRLIGERMINICRIR